MTHEQDQTRANPIGDGGFLPLHDLFFLDLVQAHAVVALIPVYLLDWMRFKTKMGQVLRKTSVGDDAPMAAVAFHRMNEIHRFPGLPAWRLIVAHLRDRAVAFLGDRGKKMVAGIDEDALPRLEAELAAVACKEHDWEERWYFRKDATVKLRFCTRCLAREKHQARRNKAAQFVAANIEVLNGVAQQLLFSGILTDIMRLKPTLGDIAKALKIYDREATKAEAETYLGKIAKLSDAMYNDWKMMVSRLRDTLLSSVPGIELSINPAKVQQKIDAFFKYIDTIRSHQANDEPAWALLKHVTNPDPSGRSTVRINWDPQAADHGVVGQLYDLFNDIFRTMLENVDGLDFDADSMFSPMRLQSDGNSIGGYRDTTIQQSDKASYLAKLTRSMLAWKVGLLSGIEIGWGVMFPELVRSSNVADFHLLLLRQEQWGLGYLSPSVNGYRYFLIFGRDATGKRVDGTDRIGMFRDSTFLADSPLNAGVTFFIDPVTKLPTVTWNDLIVGDDLIPPSVGPNQRLDNVLDFRLTIL